MAQRRRAQQKECGLALPQYQYVELVTNTFQRIIATRRVQVGGQLDFATEKHVSAHARSAGSRPHPKLTVIVVEPAP